MPKNFSKNGCGIVIFKLSILTNFSGFFTKLTPGHHLNDFAITKLISIKKKFTKQKKSSDLRVKHEVTKSETNHNDDFLPSYQSKQQGLQQLCSQRQKLLLFAPKFRKRPNSSRNRSRNRSRNGKFC